MAESNGYEEVSPHHQAVALRCELNWCELNECGCMIIVMTLMITIMITSLITLMIIVMTLMITITIQTCAHRVDNSFSSVASSE